VKVEATVDNETVYLALKSGALDEAGARPAPAGRTHLTFDLMLGLVEGRVANEELQTANDHLAWCRECGTAVDDLRDFKDQVAAELERENQLSPAGVRPVSRWRRQVVAISSFWPKYSRLIYGPALATLLLAATGWLGWQTLRRINAPSTVVTTIPSPGVSPTIPTAGALEGASVVIARLNDGQGQVTLDREGKLSGVDHLPQAYQQMIRRALTNQELGRSPLLAGLTSSVGALRNEGAVRRAGFSVIEPVGVVIFSDRPTFRWSRLDGAAGYVVEIYDERFSLAGASPPVIDPSWTASQPLRRGGIYYWQVKAVKNSREFKAPSGAAPQAKFRVLDEARASELAQARRAYPSSHLTLGLLYLQAGLLDEAEREFRALQEANPNSELAHRLLKRARTRS
jgi:hypothetical protein